LVLKLSPGKTAGAGRSEFSPNDPFVVVGLSDVSRIWPDNYRTISRMLGRTQTSLIAGWKSDDSRKKSDDYRMIQPRDSFSR
jgi:hypothetical protein